KIQGLLLKEKLTEAEHLQILLFLENPLGVALEESSLKKFVLKLTEFEKILEAIEIIALKKRLLSAIKTYRNDWVQIFLQLLFTLESNQLRDIVMKELSSPEHSKELKARIKELLDHPKNSPEAFVWYFQKVLNNDAPYFTDIDSTYLFVEALLILFNHLDNKPNYRDLSKKVYNTFTGNRFQVVRDFLKGSSKDFAEEFLLLTSKCHGFSDHDKKILRSLVEVVHASLAKEKKPDDADLITIWTTKEGYNFVQERIKQIGTSEMVDVAKEIEVARGHGDLRENAEYKSALERRNRLQSEMKTLSDQFNNARIITKDDISTQCVGVGTKVQLLDSKGKKITYSILGPWDANPDLFILSFQSKLAQAMEGKEVGEKFNFKDEEFKVLQIVSYED
ncbi:MAG: greA, partial [Chlamydiia bacterium]|nr:greA [Chlamydiia bacterium]